MAEAGALITGISVTTGAAAGAGATLLATFSNGALITGAGAAAGGKTVVLTDAAVAGAALLAIDSSGALITGAGACLTN